MKQFSLFLLTLFLGLLMSPLSLAAAGDEDTSWTDHTCQFGDDYIYEQMEGDPAPEPGYWDKLEEELAKDDTSCGEINPVTQSYEKSDCNKEGKVITEISEAFAGETSIDDGENFIKNVYHGVCCLHTETKMEAASDGGAEVNVVCNESRDIYTNSLQSCRDAGGLACEKRQWIIGTSGAGILKLYVKQLYIWGAGIVGFIAVVIMVVSGIQISVSGVSGDISSAKQRILQSIGGIVLLFMSGIILYTINPTFFS